MPNSADKVRTALSVAQNAVSELESARQVIQQQMEEGALIAALQAAEPAVAQALQQEDFADAMRALSGLRAPVDAFFEAVQVNTDNQIIRRNRLNLLSRIREAGRQIADFTRIEG